MADVKMPTAAERLEAVQAICKQLASSIDTARMVLCDGAEDANVAHLVADALGRLGWMAERAATFAGAGSPGAVGDADDWMLPGSALAVAIALDRGVAHG